MDHGTHHTGDMDITTMDVITQTDTTDATRIAFSS